MPIAVSPFAFLLSAIGLTCFYRLQRYKEARDRDPLFEFSNLRRRGFRYGTITLPHMRDMTIVGPTRVTGVSEQVSRSKVFICKPAKAAEEEACAAKILRDLTTRVRHRLFESGRQDTLDAIIEELACPKSRRRVPLKTLLSLVRRIATDAPSSSPPLPQTTSLSVGRLTQFDVAKS